MDLGGGAWTPEAVTFRKFCMSKRKNLDPLGGGRAPGVCQCRSVNVVVPQHVVWNIIESALII